MSFYKEYPKRKDRRRKHRGAKAFSASCQNHGSCGYCQRGRMYKFLRSTSFLENINNY